MSQAWSDSSARQQPRSSPDRPSSSTAARMTACSGFSTRNAARCDLAGKYYEDLTEGAVYRHAVTRTVTEMDNPLFTCLTMNPQPLHLDEEFSRGTVYGTRIVNSMFTLALVMGLSVADL